MDGLLEWFASLPPLALYLALAAAAAIENVFPPFPADTVVAFGSFMAARGGASAAGAFLSTWAGNIAGAMLVYALGRRYGAAWLQRRMKWFGGEARERRLEDLYARRGMAALFVSRFLPGLRALVPPFAGALRIPALRAGVVMATASGLWYGAITVLAYRVGSDWDALQRHVVSLSRGAGLVAMAVAAFAGAAWLHHRRRRSADR